MKSTFYLPLMVFVAMFTFACSTTEIEESSVKLTVTNAPATKTIELEISELINAHRISLSLKPLKNLSVIKSVAYTHTDYMVSVNQVNHDNFYQRKISLMEKASALKVAENVAYSYTTAETVVSAWLNSPGHKLVIEGDFTEFDISAEKNTEGKWYFTNIFIKR